MVAPQQALQNPQQTRDFLFLLSRSLSSLKDENERKQLLDHHGNHLKTPVSVGKGWLYKGESLKNSQHLVLIDLQLVVQIFVSFKPHAKDSLNSECTFLVQYKHLLVQSSTDLKRNKS